MFALLKLIQSIIKTLHADGTPGQVAAGMALGAALGLTTYGGFIDLDTEDPAPDDALEKAEPPDLSNGPHFFYGLQWWFFGLLAVGGFFYLMYDEWRGGPGAQRLRRNRRHPEDDADDAARASERPEHATVDRNHDAGHEG